MGKLDGQVALVTGASAGIGRVTALLLAAEGAHVFAAARRAALLEQVTEEARRNGLRLQSLVLDVTDGNSIAAVADAVRAATNGYGIDILVNNAGFGQMGPIEELPIERLRQQLETNLVGLVALTQLFLPAMRRRRHGRIINVSSMAGRISFPFGGAYAASKYAVEGLSDALRWELAPWGVRVALIEPGPIATSFGAVVKEELTPPADTDYPLAYTMMNQFDKGTSQGFPPEMVARAILHAASARRPRARYVVPAAMAPLLALARALPDWLVDAMMAIALRQLERQDQARRHLGSPPANSNTASPSASSQLR